MLIRFTFLFAACLLITGQAAFAQGKYFEVTIEKGPVDNRNYGKISPLNGQYDIQLRFEGSNKKQLLDGVLLYLKNRPTIKIDTILNKGTCVVYRDFATIGNMKTCMADLTALTYFFVVPEDGYLSFRTGINSKIYASVFGAKLSISPGDDVVSEQDVPFNEYKFVQPADGRTMSNIAPGGLLGKATSRKVQYKLAYPESIFDPEGKVVNQHNKTTIEAFFDGYVTDIYDFLKKTMK